MTTVTPISFGISNAFLLQDRQAVLVDTGPPGRSARLLRALGRAGVAPGDLALILHTHAHYDHCGNSAALRRLSGAPLAIHRAEADLLARGINAPIVAISPFIKPVVRLFDMPYTGVAPDILVDEEGLDLHPYGVAARVMVTPGHTEGSLTVLTEDGLALVGDLMGGGRFFGALFPGRPRYHYFAADLAQVRANLQRLLAARPTLLYVGHGGPLRVAEVARWLENSLRLPE
ncbi:MAG: MBL fold metallo-hydrolase [Anaerolineae bacterium]|nr:MBL fold metallo-hydrolase [Anaerolineae bacterium]